MKSRQKPCSTGPSRIQSGGPCAQADEFQSDKEMPRSYLAGKLLLQGALGWNGLDEMTATSRS